MCAFKYVCLQNIEPLTHIIIPQVEKDINMALQTTLYVIVPKGLALFYFFVTLVYPFLDTVISFGGPLLCAFVSVPLPSKTLPFGRYTEKVWLHLFFGDVSIPISVSSRSSRRGSSSRRSSRSSSSSSSSSRRRSRRSRRRMSSSS